MICLHTIYQMPNPNGSIVLATKPKTNKDYRLLPYWLTFYKNVTWTNLHSFRRSVTRRNFRTL